MCWCANDIGFASQDRVTATSKHLDHGTLWRKAQDVFGHRCNINTAAEGLAVDGGDVIQRRGQVDARLKARTRAVVTVGVAVVEIGDCGDAIGVCKDHIEITGRQRQVQFTRQQDRSSECDICTCFTTDKGHRTADRVHTLVERTKDKRVTTVDDIIVDRQHSDGLRCVPVVCVEFDILRIADVTSTFGIDADAGGQNGVVQRTDRYLATINHDIIKAITVACSELIINRDQLVAEPCRDSGQGIACLHGVALQCCPLESHGPDLASGDEACEFNLKHIAEREVLDHTDVRTAQRIRGDVHLDKEAGDRGRLGIVQCDVDGLFAHHIGHIIEHVIGDLAGKNASHISGCLTIHNKVRSGKDDVAQVDIGEQVDRPDFTRRRCAGQGQRRVRGRNQNLLDFVLAKVGIGIEGQLRIIGACFQRCHIDAHSRGWRVCQEDIKRIHDLRIIHVALCHIGAAAGFDDFDCRGFVIKDDHIQHTRDQFFAVVADNIVVRVDLCGQVGTKVDFPNVAVTCAIGCIDHGDLDQGALPMQLAEVCGTWQNDCTGDRIACFARSGDLALYRDGKGRNSSEAEGTVKNQTVAIDDRTVAASCLIQCHKGRACGGVDERQGKEGARRCANCDAPVGVCCRRNIKARVVVDCLCKGFRHTVCTTQ